MKSSWELVQEEKDRITNNLIREENTQLKSELQALRELLKLIEGRGCDINNPHFEQTHCPACGNVLTIKSSLFVGHTKDCWLKNELDQLKGDKL